MSIATYISSIESDRNKIRNKLVELGIATSSDKLDKLALAIEGIINQGAVAISVKEGETISIPRGFHNGSGTIQGTAGGGNYSLQNKGVITPTKSAQPITPDAGFYGISGLTVGAIPEAYQDTSSVTAKAEEVLTGKVFVTADGTVVVGEMLNNGAVDATIDVTSITYTIPKGYHSGRGKVKLVLETKTVTPTKSVQEVTPTSGKVISKLTIEAIPDKYQDVSGVTATATNVLEGDTFVDSTGKVVEGAMPEKGAVTATIDGLTTTSYNIPAGHHNGNGKVSLTDDIENALASI